MHQARRRRRLALLLVPIGLLVVATNVGSALAPTLVTDHPLLLLALDARNRHVILVAGLLDPLSYYVVGTLRLLVSDPLLYLLGYWYGEAALTWVEQRAGTVGRWLRTAEGFFAKAAYPIIFIAPNNYICLFAGASRIRPAVFLALSITGTLARLALFRAVGDIFDGARDTVLSFIAEYQIPLTIASLVLVAGQVLWERWRGQGELESLGRLEETLEDAERRPSEAAGVDLATRAEDGPSGEGPPPR